jgi:hypothetical protein
MPPMMFGLHEDKSMANKLELRSYKSPKKEMRDNAASMSKLSPKTSDGHSDMSGEILASTNIMIETKFQKGPSLIHRSK